MEDFNWLAKINRVTAPPGFETQLMARLAARQEALPKMRRALALRYSLAGAGAFLLIGFIIMNMFVLQKGSLSESAGSYARDGMAAGDSIHITEPVRYVPEIRKASSEPRTAYVLEQVSDASNRLIVY